MSLALLSIGNTPSKDKPVVTANHLAAGLAAIFEIAEKWHLSNAEVQAILGTPSRATFFKWKNGNVKTVPHDTVSRISYILGIYKNLHILFSDPAIADDWINQSNQYFGGEPAKSRMVAGDVVDLAFVRNYLDGIRGGWA